MHHDGHAHPPGHPPGHPPPHPPGAPRHVPPKNEPPLPHALRMGSRIVWWALVLGFVLSALFAASTPDAIDWGAFIARGTIIGIALAAAIIIVALMLPGGLRRK